MFGSAEFAQIYNLPTENNTNADFQVIFLSHQNQH